MKFLQFRSQMFTHVYYCSYMYAETMSSATTAHILMPIVLEYDTVATVVHVDMTIFTSVPRNLNCIVCACAKFELRGDKSVST